jgi:hypothetical protein
VHPLVVVQIRGYGEYDFFHKSLKFYIPKMPSPSKYKKNATFPLPYKVGVVYFAKLSLCLDTPITPKSRFWVKVKYFNYATRLPGYGLFFPGGLGGGHLALDGATGG